MDKMMQTDPQTISQTISQTIAQARDEVRILSGALGRTPTFHVTTFGCQMNAHDSEKLRGMLLEMGFAESESEQADYVIFNTCSIRENANLRVYGRLGRLGGYKKKNPHMLIGLCGCMMQESEVREKIAKSYPYVDVIFGTNNLHEMPALTLHAMREKTQASALYDDNDNSRVVEDLPRSRTYAFKSGVNITYGCNNFCTYCIVPYVRGREYSRRPQEILEEVKRLADDGVKEIMLLGQNVNSYGNTFRAERKDHRNSEAAAVLQPTAMTASGTVDGALPAGGPHEGVGLAQAEGGLCAGAAQSAGVLAHGAMAGTSFGTGDQTAAEALACGAMTGVLPGEGSMRPAATAVIGMPAVSAGAFWTDTAYMADPYTFPGLLAACARIDGIERIRFMTSHPKDLSDELIAVMAQEKKVCKHLHLPVQSGSTRILKRMNRRYTRESYLALVEKLLKAMPDLALTTDVIVGFPGETEADFEDTYTLFEQVRYDNAFTFLYSPRPGTPAADFPDQIPAEVAKRRFNRLLALVQETAKEKTDALQGMTLPVLIEQLDRQEKSMVSGRLENNSVVHLPGSASMIGMIVPVYLRESRGFYYIGEQAEE